MNFRCRIKDSAGNWIKFGDSTRTFTPDLKMWTPDGPKPVSVVRPAPAAPPHYEQPSVLENICNTPDDWGTAKPIPITRETKMKAGIRTMAATSLAWRVPAS